MVAGGTTRQFSLAYGQKVRITPFTLPSVAAIHPGSTSLCIQILHAKSNEPYVTRFIHGAYLLEKGIAFYKPAERLSEGKGLWSNVNKAATQKANQGKKPGEKRVTVLNTIYGGKLTGILTQSLCREMFFDSVEILHQALLEEGVTNARIIGQFHDEIVVDWWPEKNGHSLEAVKDIMNGAMSYTVLPGFPLVSEIKSAYRYIK